MITGSNSFCMTFFNKFGILCYDLHSTFPFHYSVIALCFDDTLCHTGRFSTQTQKLNYSTLDSIVYASGVIRHACKTFVSYLN